MRKNKSTKSKDFENYADPKSKTIKEGTLFVTADHGNAEIMIDFSTGNPFTAHTTDPVPFVWVSKNAEGKALAEGGRLSDIAPTMLTAMGLEVPAEMTGKNLMK